MGSPRSGYMSLLCLLATLALASLSVPLQAAVYHVAQNAPTASDANPGTEAAWQDRLPL